MWSHAVFLYSSDDYVSEDYGIIKRSARIWKLDEGDQGVQRRGSESLKKEIKMIEDGLRKLKVSVREPNP